MSMKTLSTGMNLLAIPVAAIYTYYLLSFIDASGMLWALWLLSLLIMLVSTILGGYARDEYYADQFKKMMEKRE